MNKDLIQKVQQDLQALHDKLDCAKDDYMISDVRKRLAKNIKRLELPATEEAPLQVSLKDYAKDLIYEKKPEPNQVQEVRDKEEGYQKLIKATAAAFRKYGDKKTFISGRNSWSGNELATEVEQQTEIGIKHIQMAMNLTIDLLARQKIKTPQPASNEPPVKEEGKEERLYTREQIFLACQTAFFSAEQANYFIDNLK